MRLKESGAINKSLLTLRNVVAKLAEGAAESGERQEGEGEQQQRERRWRVEAAVEGAEGVGEGGEQGEV